MVKPSKRNLIVVLLLACVLAIALGALLQICGFSGCSFYTRHSDDGMYDNPAAITAQAAKSSHGALSFEVDSAKTCAGTIKCLGFGGRDILARINSPQSGENASIALDLSCTQGKTKVVLYQEKSDSYTILAEGTESRDDIVPLPEGTSIIALIGDKADATCTFDVTPQEGATATLAITDK